MPLIQTSVLPKNDLEIDSWRRDLILLRMCCATVRITGNSSSSLFSVQILEVGNEKNLNTKLVDNQSINTSDPVSNIYYKTNSDGNKIIFNNVNNGIHGISKPVCGISCMMLSSSSATGMYDGIPNIIVNTDGLLELVVKNNGSNTDLSFANTSNIDDSEIYDVKISYMVLLR